MPHPHSVISIAEFLHSHLKNRPPADLPGITRLSAIARAQSLVAACNARLATGGWRPCYDPDADTIVMPSPFTSAIARIVTRPTVYALTLLHELTHWTGHQRRLARRRHRQPFDDIYAREELIAELGSALLCHDLAITSRPTLPHARYLNAFLAKLPYPDTDLSLALAHATRAAAYLTAIAHRRLSSG